MKCQYVAFHGDIAGDTECEVECLGGKARMLGNCEEDCLQKPPKNLVGTIHKQYTTPMNLIFDTL